MSTPEERRGSATVVLDQPIPLMRKVEGICELAEEWIADALAEKDVEIERLRQEREELARDLNDAEASLGDNAMRRALAVRKDIEHIARADERRRTAEEIKRRADATLAPSSHERTTVARICAEVGGSE